MTDILSLVSRLERPRLLMQAARHAARDYRRERALPRLLHEQPLPGSCETLQRLMMMEEMCEEARRRGAGYGAARHVEIMAAILGETCAFARTRLPQANASATSDLRLAM